MCELTFEYQISDLPEKTKSEYEERINKKLKAGCQTINKAGGYIQVNWHGEPKELRGLLIIDANKLDGLFLDFNNR